MSTQYDVIVIGGGFAGLCCALNLKGKKVLLIEERKHIARKHRGSQCSLYPFGESYDVQGTDIHFQKNNVTVPGGVMGTLVNLEVEAGGHRIISTPKTASIIIDEGIIKGALEKACIESGVDIITGTKAKSIEIETDQPSVYADKKYTAEYIVAADGSHSMAMRHVPLKRKKIGDFFELEIEADNMDLPRDSFYAEFRDITTGLYAQTYGEGYMLGVFQGLGDNGKRIDLKEYMAESIQKLKVHNVTRRYGCAMPLHFSASSSYYKNILLAGDCVSSFSMATITGAMMTGLLAAKAVIEKSDGVEGAFEEYDKAWRKELQQASLDRMKSYFFLLRRLNHKRMGRLFQALAGADLGKVGTGYYIKKLPGIIRAFI